MSSLKKFILPTLVLFGFLLLYVHNLSRSTYGGDVGDFLSASIVMGVPHAPGYPLFTILGFLLSRINFITPAFMIGLISVFSGAFGILFFYFLSFTFTKNKLISLISSLILGFSYYYWFYSEVAEVFALNNLFAISLILIALRYSFTKNVKYLFLLSFLASLSLTNHQTIVLLFPSILVLIASTLIKDLRNPKNIVFCLLSLLAGFIPYLYVPFAAAHNPPINWDKVKDLDSFLHLILRKDYGTFKIGNFAQPTFDQRFVNLRIYFFHIITQATMPVFIISIIGAIYSLLKYKKIFLAILVAFVLSGPVFVSYAGFPLYSSFNVGVYERFLILSFVVLLMYFPFGLLAVKQLFSKLFPKKEYGVLLLLVFLIIPFSLFKYNYPKTNLSSLTVGDDLSYNLLGSLPKNSVIFLSGDTVLFNTWYIHFGRNFRQDVEVINANGPTDSKYFADAQSKYLKNNPKDKKDQNTNVKVIMEISKTRPVFSILDFQASQGDKLKWIPLGLYSKLYLDENTPTEEEYKEIIKNTWKNYKIASKSDTNLVLGSLTSSEIPLFYSNRLVRIGDFFLKEYKDEDQALAYYLKALEVDNSNPTVYQILGSYYMKNDNCSIAKLNLERAIDINPYDPFSYFFLYYTYNECYKNPQKAKQVVTDYNLRFKSDFFADLKKTIKK